MTHEEKWTAVSENDASYDGIFFYAVKTTGIYCRPSCKSKQPKRENICFFDSSEEARAAGFRPCKRCRSDLLDYRPMKDIAARTKRLLEEAFSERTNLDRELKGMGVSRRRMSDIFKDEYGLTLSEYVNQLRAEAAKRMLAETDDAIIDIAYSVGFGGLSSFYRFFKSAAGTSPAAYRKEHHT